MLSSPELNRRLLLLIICLILTSGSVAYTLLPRMEDPRLTPRAARVITIFPGADAERVESLVTEKLERALREIEQVKEIRSSSSTSVSFVGIELADSVDAAEAAIVWARVRDKLEDAHSEMPRETLKPVFKEFDITASALVVALRWDMDGEANYAILHRLLKQLRDRIDEVPGTEKTELFGAPEEEILVTLDANSMTALNLNPIAISNAISASDAKVAAGTLRNDRDNILIEVAGELDTLKRIGQIPIQREGEFDFVELADVAHIEKSVKRPLESKIVLDDQPAIALGVQIQPTTRLNIWAKNVEKILVAFQDELPEGISLERVFQQERYVKSRMTNLFRNLLFGALAIFVVILLMMGLRSAVVIGLTLPLVSLMVLSCMYWMGIPIHQMSISGLIIALGLMIDNAIVVTDEIAHRLRLGDSREEAVGTSIRFLSLPLIGSTLTTALSFSPIILMEGPAGEFVGSIAVVSVCSVFCSLLLAFFVIGPLAGASLTGQGARGWLANGVSSSIVSNCYRWFVKMALHNPAIGVMAACAAPVLGFIFALDLAEQFFPPAERNQFQIEITLPASSSIVKTEQCAAQIRRQLLKDPRIVDVQWFLGESAPMFYYNVIPLQRNKPSYGQAIVDCVENIDLKKLLRELQADLQADFPAASVLVRQLEQGPPFDAPIEVRLKGPDQKILRELGNELRLLLSHTSHVHHTRAGFSEPAMKVSFEIDEQQVRMAGLDYRAIARELDTSLEGTTGGSVIEASEELPVRVRVSGGERRDIANIASMDLLVQNHERTLPTSQASYSGLPISSISTMNLKPETVSITRLNGQRINEVQAFITAGVLPSTVLEEFQTRLANSDVSLPNGYSISYGGAEEERNNAVQALIGNTFVIIAVMISVLVVATHSFRLAGLLFLVAALSVGLGLGSLYLVGYPWGFMSMVAIMGMIGVAVNDSIVVLAAIREVPIDHDDALDAIAAKVMRSTRHILSTTVTTIVGFTPLFLFGGDFWSPVAVAISGGVGGATVLALLLIPCAYVLLKDIK